MEYLRFALLSMALITSTGCAVETAHAAEEHRHTCRVISDVREGGRCCKETDAHGRCTSHGHMVCYERACSTCNEACEPSCSGCG